MLDREYRQLCVAAYAELLEDAVAIAVDRLGA